MLQVRSSRVRRVGEMMEQEMLMRGEGGGKSEDEPKSHDERLSRSRE